MAKTYDELTDEERIFLAALLVYNYKPATAAGRRPVFWKGREGNQIGFREFNPDHESGTKWLRLLWNRMESGNVLKVVLTLSKSHTVSSSRSSLFGAGMEAVINQPYKVCQAILKAEGFIS